MGATPDDHRVHIVQCCSWLDGNRLIENQKDFVMKLLATTFGSLVVSVVAALAALLISEEANYELS